MLNNYIPSQRRTVIKYWVVFEYDESRAGFAFPCDADGNVDVSRLSVEAQESYRNCMDHPERFYRWNVCEMTPQSVFEPASGDCGCGAHISLFDQYLSACQCPSCGQWYNLFGREVVPPEEWEEDI